MTERISEYAAILARCPPVAWAMPEVRPDETAISNKDEYLEDALKLAAKLEWLAVGGPSLIAPADWIAEEVAHMRFMLEWGGPPDRPDELGWFILGLLGVVQSWQSSSAAVGR